MVSLVARLPYQIVAHVRNNGFQVVIVVSRHFLVAFSLVPQEGFYLKPSFQLRQFVVDAGTDILREGFQQ